MPDAHPAPSAMSGLKRRISTIRLFYFMAGIGISAWAIIVPFAKIRFRLDDGTLGLILMASGTGGVLVMPLAGPLLGRFGSRAVLLGSGIIFALTLPLLNLAPNVPLLVVLLFVFGAAFGVIDIAMNAQAVVTETQAGRLLMSGFHAMYSFGSLTVALATALLLKAGFGHAFCAALSGLAAAGILTQSRYLLPPRHDLPAGPAFAMPGRDTLLLGACCFACFLTEGAITDWSTVFLRFTRHVPLSSATLGYAGFSIMMALARLSGDKAAERLGKPAVMRLGALIAASGLFLSVLVPSAPLDVLGFAMVGIGAGNIAPLVFSAAARIPGMPANLSVPAVVSLGYIGFLLGPVLIGLISRYSSLGVALGLDGLMMLLLCLGGRAVA